MFGRRKDDKFGSEKSSTPKPASKTNGRNSGSAQSNFTRQSQSRPTSHARDGKPAGRGAVSLIGPDLKIEGTLQSEGEIQVDGELDGNIRSEMLVIGEQGRVKGDVTTNEVTIFGHVNGNIRSRKVQLMPTARVVGDIFHNILAIENGAFFEGKSLHVDDPLSADRPKRKGGAQRTSTTNTTASVRQLR